MNSRALKCFIEVYEKKSVAAASRDLYISPQGLSKVIKQLEYDLEVDLFYRGAQGMDATEAGELLYARARHIVYLLDDIKKEIGIMGGSKAALQVVVTYATALVVSFEFLGTFTESHPKIQLKIDEYPDEYPLGDLFQDEADVGIVLGHTGLPNCTYDLLVPGLTVVVVAKNHPLASRKEVSVADLRPWPLITKTTEPGRENALVEACTKAGFTPTVRYSSGNLAAVHRSCLDGRSVAESVDIIERAFVDDNLVTIKLQDRLEQNLWLVSRDRDMQNRAVTQFIKYIKENLRS